MNKTFKYTNFAPHGAKDSNGNRMKNTNVINLSVENGEVTYSRSYVNSKGEVSPAISHTFEPEASLNEIVKQIHWGCCGWTANMLQLSFLEREVGDFLRKMS